MKKSMNVKLNGEIVHEIPDSAFKYRYMILQRTRDGIYYFGADNDRAKAEWVAKVNTDRSAFLYVVLTTELNEKKMLSEILDLDALIPDKKERRAG